MGRGPVSRRARASSSGDPGDELLEQLRRAGVPEAEVAQSIVALCRRLGYLAPAAPDSHLLDEIAALTSDDDDDAFVWDNPNFFLC